VTVDVEDFHDGMVELGHPVPGEGGIRLGDLLDLLHTGQLGEGARLTFFVVGKFAGSCRAPLVELAERGHEIASHGPDHGQLPQDRRELVRWLAAGREMVEQVVQRPVVGFRPPRFDAPASMPLGAYREAIGEAGFTYVSDTRASPAGGAAGVVELPVTRVGPVPLGGGSYQRFLPRPAVAAILARARRPAVFYYHSYDFSLDALPPLTTARSAAEVRQLLVRRRIPRVFLEVLGRFGSVTCREVASELRPVL
jgi:hypothetical protein